MGVPGSATADTDSSTSGSSSQAPLIGGDLVLQSTGKTRDDLDVTMFELRRRARGGRPRKGY
jgi:hypothetical protein